MNQQIETSVKPNLTDSLLEVGWLLVAILTPLAINLWAKQPFDPPKAVLLRSLVWMMAGLWLVDNLLAWRPPWRELENNPLLWPVLAVAAVQILATALAVDRNLSLWGNYERSQGILTLLSYLLLFLIVSARLRTLAQARRLVVAMAATGIPLAGIGLAQTLGWDPVGLISDARSLAYATLGRSNFLGAYLAMLLPLTLTLVLIAHRHWQRLAGIGLVAGQLIMIALTLARGAWLAAAVAVAVFGLLWLWPRLDLRWRKLAAAGGLVALTGGLAGMLWLGSEGGSTAARLAIWRATLDLIARRPLLGYGPDSLGLIFPRVYPPQLVYYQGRGLAVDRAHNLFLDWTVTTGGLGLLAGLALLATFFIAGWRAIMQTIETERRALLVACLAAVAGSVAGNLVSFDVTATATTTWLLMALTVTLARPARQTEPDTSMEPVLPPHSRWMTAGLTLLVMSITGVFILKINVRPMAADVMARTADQRAALDDWPGAIQARQQAVALWPAEPAHHLALSWAYLQQAQIAGTDPLPWLYQAEAELLAARDLRPGDFNVWAALGELYGVWGNRWDAARLPLAHQAYRQATSLAPHHATLYANWGMIDMTGQQFAPAAAKFRQAVDLDATDGYAFTHLGDAELAQGHVEQALEAYLQAAHWAPELSYAHLGLARCYWQLGQREAAKLAVDRALQLAPDNPDAWALRQEMSAGP